MVMRRLRAALADHEVLMLVVMAVFAAAFVINVQDNPRAGRLFPTVIGLITLGLIAVESAVVFRNRKRGQAETGTSETEGTRPPKGLVLKFVALIFLYYLAILLTGYLFASFLFSVLIMWFLGIESKVEILLVSLGTVIALYLIFVWGFSFILPAGTLF
jgi:hypothetical protein